ncbi:MAG TPA: DinB family protein [Herpetosiphonaceae bacterium]
MDTLLDQLNRSAQQIVNLVRDVPEAALRRKPGREWAGLEVLGHLRDRERLLGERMTLFADGEARIPNWDQEAAAAGGRYLGEALQTTIAEFQELRHTNVQRLAALAPEIWDRVGQHEVQGPYSLRTEVERVVGHDEAHLRQLEVLLTP